VSSYSFRDHSRHGSAFGLAVEVLRMLFDSACLGSPRAQEGHRNGRVAGNGEEDTMIRKDGLQFGCLYLLMNSTDLTRER
jgi:hypothetical protein